MITEKKRNVLLLITAIIVSLGTIWFFVTQIFPRADINRTKMAFLLVLLIMLFVTAVFIYYLFSEREYKYSKAFLFLTICWGLIFQIVMPPFSGTDEWAHYTSAYYLSDRILGTTSIDVQDVVTVYHTDGTFEDVSSLEDYKTEFNLPALVMRKCDVPAAPPSINFPMQYDNLFNGHIRASEEEKELVGVQYTYYTPWIRYIPVGIGITLGRLLGLSGVLTIYMGRFMNTLFFLLIGLLALKLSPVGKMQLVSFTMFPVVLASVTSYTYDAISISLCMLVVTMCMHYARDDVSLKIWDILLIAVTFMFLVPNKGVYSLYALLLLMIPFSKWKDVFKRTMENIWGKITAAIVVVLALVIFVWKIFPSFVTFFNIFNRAGGTASEMIKESEAWTMSYALSHKSETVWAWIHTLTRYGWRHFEQVNGYEPGHHNLVLKNPEICIILLIVVLLLGLILQKGNRLPRKNRILWNITATIVIIGIVAGCMVRFTPAGHYNIAISYRYYLPVYMAGLLFYSTDEGENSRALSFLLLQNLILIPITCSILLQLLTF